MKNPALILLCLCALVDAFLHNPLKITNLIKPQQNRFSTLDANPSSKLLNIGDIVVAQVDDFVGTINDPLVQLTVRIRS